MRRGIGIAVGVAGMAAVAWEMARRRDERRLERDPETHVLEGGPQGRPDLVTSTDGTELHVEVAGPSSARSVVLVHGWGMSTRFWHYQLRDLPPDLRVVAYDQRGHGRSGTAPDGSYELRDLAEDLDAVLDVAVPTGEKPVLVGHSLGGMTILEWARMNGGRVAERIDGAVLLDTSAESVTAGTYAGLALGQRLLSGLGRRFVTSTLPTPDETTPISTRIVHRLALGEDAAPAHVALTERLFFDCPDDVRAALGLVLNRLDLEEAVTHLCVPAVVVTGTEDRLVPPRYARRLARALPAGRLVELDGAGHQVALERHRDTNDLIRRFVEGIGSEGVGVEVAGCEVAGDDDVTVAGDGDGDGQG